MTTYPVVEAVFDPVVNLVDYLIAPAAISATQAEEATNLAMAVVNKMDFVGLMAVELFLDREGGMWINELAPRTHNSGHNTIEGNVCSQFEQHLRAVLNLPLGDTSPLHPCSAMVNLIAEPDAHGLPCTKAWKKCWTWPNVYVHLYGKSTAKPHRKMGHVTLTGNDLASIQRDVLKLRQMIRVKGSFQA